MDGRIFRGNAWSAESLKMVGRILLGQNIAEESLKKVGRIYMVAKESYLQTYDEFLSLAVKKDSVIEITKPGSKLNGKLIEKIEHVVKSKSDNAHIKLIEN